MPSLGTERVCAPPETAGELAMPARWKWSRRKPAKAGPPSLRQEPPRRVSNQDEEPAHSDPTRSRTEAEENQALELPLPYQILFSDCYERRGKECEQALLDEPAALRTEFFAARAKPADRQGQWDALNDYLAAIEARFAKVAKRHSPCFWRYCYRRTGVALLKEHPGKTDGVTVSLVRMTVESGIEKYGDLSRKDEFFTFGSEAEPESIWGGRLWSLLQKADSPDLEAAVSAGIARERVLLPRTFEDEDLIDLARLEGLGYEYWRTKARMRSVGKGGCVDFGSATLPLEPNRELGILERSYDKRNANEPFATTSAGSTFFADPKSRFSTFLLAYNSRGASYPESLDLPLKPGTTNFLVGVVDLRSYLASHAHAEAPYKKRRHHALSSLLVILAACTQRAMSTNTRSDGTTAPETLMQLYQRAYMPTDPDWYFKELRDFAVSLADEWLGKGGHSVDQDFKNVIEQLTLSEKLQPNISMWTRGPGTLFIPVNESTILVDFIHLGTILQNTLFGVPHDQGDKGTSFEDSFHRLLQSNGTPPLPNRELRWKDARGKTHRRETDAAIRVGSTLFLCECRSMERPLDFDLGKPKTVDHRTADLDDKVNQVLSLSEFVAKHPKGSNYDFTWATEIIPLVVSPFAEWIWSLDKRLWIDSDTPRILSVTEACEFISKTMDDNNYGRAGRRSRADQPM